MISRCTWKTCWWNRWTSSVLVYEIQAYLEDRPVEADLELLLHLGEDLDEANPGLGHQLVAADVLV